MTAVVRVVTIGETMALMRTREIGSLRHATDLVLGVGGAESNVAIGLRRLGIDASWLGRVGEDSLGKRVVRELRAEGVEVRSIVDPDAPTGLMIKERLIGSSTQVSYYRTGSAGSRLTPADLPSGWVESATLLHITGITALVSESARECLAVAIDRAHAAGVMVSFDINYRSTLLDSATAQPRLREIAERSDIVFGGPEELELINPGSDAVASAHRLLESRCAEVVLKRGPYGATTLLAGASVEASGFPIDVADTVGAGDAFVAGYLSAITEGLDVRARLDLANACGAIACSGLGDWESNPTRRDVERFLRAGDPVAR